MKARYRTVTSNLLKCLKANNHTVSERCNIMATKHHNDQLSVPKTLAT